MLLVLFFAMGRGGGGKDGRESRGFVLVCTVTRRPALQRPGAPRVYPGLHFAIPLNPNVVPSVKFPAKAQHPANIAAFRKAASRYKASAQLPWASVRRSNRVS